MKIQIAQTLPNGQVTQQVLSKEGGEPLRIQVQPGAKISFNVEGAKSADAANAKAKTGNIKKTGSNLVLEAEGEILVEVTDFYSTAGASVGDVGWNYAAVDTGVAAVTPEAQALVATSEVSASASASASASFWGTGWGIAAGVAGVAAAVNAQRDDKPKSTVTSDQGDSGVVVDGYLYGATVRRANGSGNTVTTDENGAFTGLTGTGEIVVTGGTDVLSGQPFTGRLVAPDDSAIITPLTTLVVKLAEQMKAADSNLSSADAQAQAVVTVNQFAGVDPNFDLLNVDPLARRDDSADAMTALKAGIQVATVLQAMTGSSAGYQDAAEALAAKMLATDANSKVTGTADLADAAKLDAILNAIPEANRNAGVDTGGLSTAAGSIVAAADVQAAVAVQQTALTAALGSDKMPISPTVVITDGQPDTAKAGETVVFTFTFSEDVSDFDASKVNVTNGTKGAFGGAGRVYTLEVVLPSSGEGNLQVGVNPTRVIGAVSGLEVVPTSRTQAYDAVAPKVVITDDKSVAANGDVTFTYTFSEAVTGFDASKITVAGGTKGTFTATSATVYTLVVTPTASSTGNIQLTTNTTGVTDAAGNVATAPAVYTQAVDTVAPTLTITDSASGVAGVPVTFTYTFSEGVTGFDASKITVAGGTKGTFTAVSATVYTLVVTPTANSTTPISLTTSTTGVIDAAGNVATAPAVYTQAVDTVAPTLTITDSASGVAGGPVTFTYTFSEGVTGFDASKITVAGGTKGTFTAVSATEYTLVVTPAANSTGNIVLTNSVSGVKDLNGNDAAVLDPAVSTYAQDFNTNGVSVTITDNKEGTLKAGETVTYTFTFSDGVTGFDASKITVAGGTKGTFTATSATVYTLVVTPATNSTSNITVSTAIDGVESTSGLPVLVGSHSTQAMDTVVPTVTITDSAANTATGDVTFTYTFSEAVTGFDASKITVAGGTKGTFTATSATVYTLVVTPTANSTTPISLTTSTTGVIDAAGNVVTAPTTYTQAVDTVAPTLTITDSASGVAGGPVTFTYTFSEDVTGFDASKITVAGGIKGTFTAVSATEYTLVVTPAANSAGNIMLTNSVSGVKDLNGNDAAALDPAVSTYTQAFNTNGVSVSITDNKEGALKAGETVTYTFTFTEAVTGFDASKINVTNGSKGAFAATSATVYTLEVTPATNSTSSMEVSTSANGVTAPSGATVLTGSSVQPVDTVVPTVTITDSAANTANGAVTFTYTFSEAVTGFDASKITVAGGTKGTFTATSATVYTLVVTPTANSTTPISLTTSTTGVIDAAGNVVTAPAVYNQPVDTVVPTVTITDSVANTATGDVTFTYTFSEAVTGFDTSKITVAGGTKGAFSGSGAVYTLVVTPTANSTTPISLTTSTTGVIDAAGNVVTAPAVYNQPVDTVVPTVTITDSAANTANGAVTFTYTFSEAVTGFDTSKITVAGGTKGTFTATSATVYTLVVTPTANSTTPISLTTSTTGVIDAAGNVVTAPAVYNQPVDTVVPTVTITDSVANTATGDVTFTYTFSEAVTGFDTSKITVAGGTKGAFSGSGAVYTLVVTPTANSTTPISLTTSTTGVIDAAGNVVTAPAVYNQPVDTVVPTVTITDSAANTANGAVTFTYTFSEAVTGFDASKITVAGGTKGTFTATSATVYTLVVTPTANSTTPISLTTSTTGVIDAAGNVVTAPAVYNQPVDTVVPTVTITDSVANTATGDVTFTYTFSEAVTGFDTSKITVAGGTKGAFSGSGAVYTLVVTPTANSTTPISLTTSTTGVIDAAGNVVTAPAVYNQPVDTVVPTVTITDSAANTANGAVTFTYTFSEAVTGFDTSKITVAGGTKGTFTATSATVYTLVVTPTANSTTPISLTTSTTGVIDAAGNVVTAPAVYNQPVDTVVPTVTITDSVANTATGDVTFTYTFSEAVTGFDTSKITVAGGTKGAFSGSGAVYTLVVTPTANSTTPISLTTSTTGVIDAAGNVVTAPAVYNQPVDTVVPTVTITDSAANTANGAVTFTYTFSEAVTGFDASKITVAGGTKGTFTATSATVYTLVVTPTANSTTPISLTTSTTGVIDAAGNVVTAPAVYNQPVDTVVPTVTITDSVANTATGDVTFTYTFSEAVTGFDASKITVAGGTKGTFTATSATVYTLVVTPTASSTGNIQLTTNTTGVTDAAGNVVTVPSPYTQAYDTNAFGLTISDGVSGTANGDVTFTFTFSEGATGFDTNKITVTGGTKGTFTAVSSTVYTLVVTPTANSTTPITISTSPSGVTSVVGSKTIASVPDYTQAVDTVVPTVTITDSAANTATGDVTFTYTFSEAVTGFDASKITVAGGTKGTFTATSATVYTLVVTPTANSTTPISLTTSTTGVIDAAGNVVTAPAVYNQPVDTVVPTVTITDSAANTANGAVTFTYTFSEAVTGFDTSKITVAGGTKGTFTATSATVYTLVVTPTANSTTPISLTTSTTGVIDAAGNVVTAPAVYNQPVDTVVPTVTITDSAANTATGDVTFTYTFSEAVTGFDASKITVAGGTKGTFTATSATVYTLVVTPTANSTTPISLTTSTTGVIDAAGNVVTAPAVYNQPVDTVVPTVTITDSAANTATGDVTFTYTFSEAVTGFDTSKITVAGGTKGTFTATSATVYTLVVTPTANSTTPISLTTSTTGVIDAAGNVVTAPAVYNQPVDTVVPTVTITDSAANTANGAVTFTYTFSEAVTGFDASKITVAGGTKGTFTATSATVYTLVVTPTANSTTPISLTTSTTGVIDAAGNVVTAPAVYNQPVDTVVPTVTITDSAANTATGDVTFTYTFSEAVTGFDASKITVAGGTKGAFSGSGAVYTLVVTPTANSTTPISLTTSTTGVIDAAGNVVTAPAVYNQPVDTVVPTVTITDSAANTATGDVTFTYTFSEAVTGFDASKITVAGGTKGTFTATSPTVYTLVVTPTANSTTPISLTTSTTGVIDAAGNVVTASAVYNQPVDTVVPTVSSVVISASGASDTQLNAGDVVTVTTTYSEVVSGQPTTPPTLTIGSEAGIVMESGVTVGNTLTWTYTISSAGTTDMGAISVVGNMVVGVSDSAGNAVAGSTPVATGTFTADTIAPTNTYEKGIYDAATDTFTLVGTNMLSIKGGTGAVDKNLFDWSKFDINLGGDGVFASITASDIDSVIVGSDSRLSIKLSQSSATTLEGHAQWSLAGVAVTDVLSIGAGFTRDAAGNMASTDGKDTIRFNNINLGTHQGGGDSGTWAGVNAGILSNAVLVNDNQIFYVWDRNASGTHESGDMITFSGTSGLATFMGKGTSSNVTEVEASRTFTINGVALRLPTDGNPASINHVDPANLVGGVNYADARDIYILGNPVNAPGTVQSGWYTVQGTAIGTSTANTSGRLAGDPSDNPGYNDLLAIWDAFNGSGVINSVWTGTGWTSQINGAPSGWASTDQYWSATISASGHSNINFGAGFVNGTAGDSTSRFIAFEVL